VFSIQRRVRARLHVQLAVQSAALSQMAAQPCVQWLQSDGQQDLLHVLLRSAKVVAKRTVRRIMVVSVG